MKKHYTKTELLKKFRGRFINAYPHHYVYTNPKTGRYETVYGVFGVSNTIKENHNLPEDEIIS